jgi:hypothetical protein
VCRSRRGRRYIVRDFPGATHLYVTWRAPWFGQFNRRRAASSPTPTGIGVGDAGLPMGDAGPPMLLAWKYCCRRLCAATTTKLK